MDRPTLTVADIFRRSGEAYRHAAGRALATAQRRVMSAIESCRTVALGGHVEQCDRCGHTRVWYNSCRNRHCPTCQSLARAAWIEDRTADLVHDHGDTFATFCLGKLYLTTDSIGFRNDSGIHNWEIPVSGVREAARNAVYASDKKAFHLKLTTATNYNFIAVNDQLEYVYPDPILIAILKVRK